MAAFLVLVALTGGASRADVLSLVILRPAAVLVLGFAIWYGDRKAWSEWRPLILLGVATVALTVLHLIPLPPALWTSLPGRGIVSEIERVAGLSGTWRPISMVPGMTWNALSSLAIPAAILLLIMSIGPTDRYRVLGLLILIGLASGLIGIMQVAGPPASPLYFYAQTTNDSAVGLFANRNHAGVLLACLFPMLAAWVDAAEDRGSKPGQRRRAMAVAAAVVVFPLILVNGSRAGLVLGLAGLGSAALLHLSRPRTGRRSGRRPWLMVAMAVALAVALIIVFVVTAQDRALGRLLDTGSSIEERLRFWPAILALIPAYMPVGSGIGTFVEVYQVSEPYWALDRTYLNHAHNEYIEVALTAGAPGLLLLAAAAILWVYWSWKAWLRPAADRRGVILARLGSIVTLLLALASLSDYPLRTPLMMALFIVAAAWLNLPRRETLD